MKFGIYAYFLDGNFLWKIVLDYLKLLVGGIFSRKFLYLKGFNLKDSNSFDETKVI